MNQYIPRNDQGPQQWALVRPPRRNSDFSNSSTLPQQSSRQQQLQPYGYPLNGHQEPSCETVCKQLQYFITRNGRCKKFLAVSVVFSACIQVSSAMVCIYLYSGNAIAVSVATSVIFTNGLLILGVISRRREILILWLWFYGLLFVMGTIVGFPHLPVVVIITTGINMFFVFKLLKSFDQSARNETSRRFNQHHEPPAIFIHAPPNSGSTAATRIHPRSPASSIPRLPQNDLLSETELATISARIAAHELAMQQRQSATFNANLRAADSGLPTYEEIMQEKEKMKEEELIGAASTSATTENPAEVVVFQNARILPDEDEDEDWRQPPPPPYGEALRLMIMKRGLPDVEQ